MYNVSESRLVLYFNVMCKKKKKEQITKDKKRYVRKKKTIRRNTHRYLDVYRHSIDKKIIDTMCTSFTDKKNSFYPSSLHLSSSSSSSSPSIVVIPARPTLYICNRINLQLVRPNRIVDRVIFVHCTFLNTRSMERRIPFLFISQETISNDFTF